MGPASNSELYEMLNKENQRKIEDPKRLTKRWNQKLKQQQPTSTFSVGFNKRYSTGRDFIVLPGAAFNKEAMREDVQ